MKFAFVFFCLICLLPLTAGLFFALNKEDTQLLVDTVVQEYGYDPNPKQCDSRCDVLFSDKARRMGCGEMCFSIKSYIATYSGH